MTRDKKKTVKQLLMGAGGVLLILAGVFSLCFSWLALWILTLVLGLASVLCGICYILAFLFLKRTVGAGFLLADGIVTGVLGLLLLLNRWIPALSTGVLLTTLLELIGISLIVFSVQAKNYKIRRWWALVAAGGACMLLGLCMQIIPSWVSIAFGVLAGVLLIAGGIATILGMFMAYRNKDKVITVREKDIEFIPDEPEQTRDEPKK